MTNSTITNDYSSDMKLGFGFMQVQDNHPFQNFLQKMEVDEKESKLTLTFSKFNHKPVVIDFKSQKMILSSENQTSFKKFISVTFEYVKEKKAVALKTIRFNKGKLEKGIKYLSIDDAKHVKLINFLEIYENNYTKTSQKLVDNDADYVFPIPDFYRTCLTVG
jgi:hypothetical protein